MRYIVRPIFDENCNSLGDTVILETDDIFAAKEAGARALYEFGAGIEDTATGLIDVGFGFGVPCPEPDAE